MTEKRTTISFPILGILGLMFIYLKLTGAIAWSWWWVLAPFWIPLAFALVVLAVVAVFLRKGVYRK